MNNYYMGNSENFIFSWNQEKYPNNFIIIYSMKIRNFNNLFETL